ncbi:ion transporter [Thioalkalivibrio thiocyanodenitrificans]|uniref:ion transporter n=1 Tax=Thioalkalivibrio thiocyanodenitrificans TaxID=243063 RepID=UPI00036C2567|nr:ion transporter [Thioalkalivibrio thiocyanodenitrificans]
MDAYGGDGRHGGDQTEPFLTQQASSLFFGLEVAIVSLFLVEYLARLYAAGEESRYRGFAGRMRHVFTGWALVDLAAILPFIITAGTHNTFLVRLLKLARLLRLARLGRFSMALSALIRATHTRRYELLVSVIAAGLLLVFSASALYVVEGGRQPEAFGSIPRALWWSIATLTTVGYGDVTPVTVLGRTFAGVTAIAGIGLIAMPTGILAAAFSDAFQKESARGRDRPNIPKGE